MLREISFEKLNKFEKLVRIILGVFELIAEVRIKAILKFKGVIMIKIIIILLVQFLLLNNICFSEYKNIALQNMFKRKEISREIYDKNNIFIGELYKNIDLSKQISDEYKNILVLSHPADGKGDVVGAIKIAEILKKKYPAFNIQILVYDPNYRFNDLNELNFSKVPLIHIKYNNFSNFSKELINKKMLIIQGSADDCFYNRRDFFLANDKLGKYILKDNPWIYFSEYNYDTRDRSCDYDNYLTGLGKNEELGMFINEVLDEESKLVIDKNKIKACFENAFLKKYYNPENNIYYCYMNSVHAIGKISKIFFVSFVILKEKKETNNVDIFLPKPWRFLCGDDIDEGIKAILIQSGFSEIQIISEEYNYKKLIKIQENKGKKLRLLEVSSLKSNDYLNLFKSTEKFCGLTGDQSLSEAISFNKIPFYEIKKHKIDLFFKMRSLANDLKLKTAYGYLDAVYYLLKVQENESFEKINKYLLDENLAKEIGELNQHIKDNYNIRERMIQKVNRAFIHYVYPDVKELEELLMGLSKFDSNDMLTNKSKEQLQRAFKNILKSA